MAGPANWPAILCKKSKRFPIRDRLIAFGHNLCLTNCPRDHHQRSTLGSGFHSVLQGIHWTVWKFNGFWKLKVFLSNMKIHRPITHFPLCFSNLNIIENMRNQTFIFSPKTQGAKSFLLKMGLLRPEHGCHSVNNRRSRLWIPEVKIPNRSF